MSNFALNHLIFILGYEGARVRDDIHVRYTFAIYVLTGQALIIERESYETGLCRAAWKSPMKLK